METAIKRNLFDPILQTQLHRPRLLDRHVNVLCVAVHQVLMNDEARGIFIHQQQTTELHRLSSFAALVKLCVRFKDAEQLVFVGNRFAEQHATPSRAADLSRQPHEMLDRSRLYGDVQIRRG